MATAVDNPPQSKTAALSVGLIPASLIGAGLLAVAFTVVGVGVSRLVAEVIPGNYSANSFLKVGLSAAALLVTIVLVFRILKTHFPAGARGGAFLSFAGLGLTYLVSGWVSHSLGGTGFVGQLIAALILVGLLFGCYKLLTGARGRRWMHALEHQGWFSAFSYKKSQGQRVRKWTMIGILLVGGSGVYAVINQGMLPAGEWAPRVPFLDVRIPLLSDVPQTGPILLIALTLWIAWRSVNVPPFADFLIATEAEMNKVSWTPLRKLVKDTVVVLVFTALLTGFLLTVDLFWGWTLSHPWVGVLPAKQQQNQIDVTGQKAEW